MSNEQPAESSNLDSEYEENNDQMNRNMLIHMAKEHTELKSKYVAGKMLNTMFGRNDMNIKEALDLNTSHYGFK